MDPLDAIKITFFEECSELLEALEAGLLELQDGTQGTDTIDAVFRAVHSIKGGAGAFDLTVLVGFAHEFETALDALRSGRLAVEPAVINTFLSASDRLGDLVAAYRNGETPQTPTVEDLQALIGNLAPVEAVGDEDDFAPVMLDFGLDPIPEDDTPPPDPAHGSPPHRWSISFEPLPDLLISGNEPLFLFRALEVLGHIKVTAKTNDLPTLTDMQVNMPRLRWHIVLEPSAPDLTETEIESVFEFALDLCLLTIEPLTGDQPSFTDPDETVAADPASVVAPAPADLAPVPVAPEPAGEAPQGQAENAATPATPPASATIRVDLGRVDRLVNLVGELVISQSMLAQEMTRAGFTQHSEAVASLDELQQLTRDMQDSVMAIRAQPVKSLFQRMTRIVRETAQATQKDVRLVTEGEGTEIDKTVVERLADPLTHMIRNAIDHGLETPDDRRAAGKSPTGTVRLKARQQSDRVVIEISDDGRGIDRKRVVARAIERGLIPADRTLDQGEIDRLLFKPGFSTNDKVSNLSGRGVGMDVVQRAIRDLNGTVSISSEERKGCTISISLPLTLAILDGMIVRSNQQRMVIPLSSIIETQTYGAARIEQIAAKQQIVYLHDRFVPLVDLAIGMGFQRATAEGDMDDDCALLFVQPDEGGPFALCVDAIEAQRQVVIKGLGDNFGHVPCVSAATILGDGQVALIVDPGGIAALSNLSGQNLTTNLETQAS